MQAGEITIDGMLVGLIEINLSSEIVTLGSNFEGYEPGGRSERGIEQHGHHFPVSHQHKNQHHFPGHSHHPAPGKHHHPGHDHAPAGKEYQGDPGHTYEQGSVETDAAIVRAARDAGVNPNTMRGIASIESGMNPSSNANRKTQYKGLYQIGHDEWRRTGEGGNIYSAEDNSKSMANLVKENSRQFKNHFGRDPTDTEIYMMHQQGLGFYTKGAMTNIGGNPYPGMHGPQTHESFEAGWGHELARRKAGYEKLHPTPTAKTQSMPDDLFANGDFGKVQDDGKAKWGWHNGVWKDLHKSNNIDDRRNVKSVGHTSQELNESALNKVSGTIDTLKRGKLDYDSSLSKEAGISDLPLKGDNE